MMNDYALLVPSNEILYLKPIEAYRRWHVVLTERGPRLVGLLSTGEIWTPKEHFKARCLVAGGSADKYHFANPGVPARDCTCGVYGRRDKNDEGGSSDFRKLSRGALCGKVALWGKVIEDEGGGGWAATFAYPLSLSGFFCICCEKTHGLESLDACKLLPMYRKEGIKGGIVFSCTPDFSTHVPSAPSPLGPSETLRVLADEYELVLE